MTDNAGKSGGGFLGDNFRSCPSCGELIPTDLPGCRFCGATIGPSERPSTGTQSRSRSIPEPSPYNAEQRTAPDVPGKEKTADRDHLVRAATVHYTSDGKKIPPEYGSRFNPSAFCAPAFFFPDLWHAEKGLIGKARNHFLLRMTNIGALTFMIIMSVWLAVQQGDPENINLSTGVIIGLVTILWFFAWLIDLIFSFKSATTAHRDYTELINSVSDEEMARIRRNGFVAYWTILWLPFLVFLIAFFIMLSQVTEGVK